MGTARKRRKGSLERELEALAPACEDPTAEGAAALLDAALASKHAHVVARAAGVIKTHGLTGHDDALRAAWDRLRRAGTPADVGCHGKVTVLDALDFTEHADAEPFLEATRYTQVEWRFGGNEDTATNVRIRGALALTRLRYPDMLLVLGRLLADCETHVRAAAARALAEHGDRNGAALLLFRLAVGDEEGEVLSDSVRALFVLAPDEAARVARPMLNDPALRELAAYAAVSSESDAALQMLLDVLAETVLATDREVLLHALGVSRRPIARDYLLSRVAEGGPSDAPAAVQALGVHAYDARLVEEVRRAAARNAAVDLEEALAAAFPDA